MPSPTRTRRLIGWPPRLEAQPPSSPWRMARDQPRALTYSNELKFVKIVTNTGARLPLEHGACYEATVVKQVDSTEEYVCLDSDSTYSQQYDCGSYREHEVIPTFILYPDHADDPDNYSESFVMIRRPP